MDDRKDKNENEENESDFWSDALDDIMRRRAWKEWLGEMFDMVMCVMIAAGFTVALTRVFFCISIVSGRSMEPTLQNRDLVVLQRVGRHTDYGDIVACKDRQGELLIKRVIGLEGGVIQIDGPNGVVYRNGQPLDEPYIVADSYYTGDEEGPITVEEGCVFVLGDNRPNSADSRRDYVGQIREKDVKGELLFRLGNLSGLEKDIRRLQFKARRMFSGQF